MNNFNQPRKEDACHMYIFKILLERLLLSKSAINDESQETDNCLATARQQPDGKTDECLTIDCNK